MIRSFDRGDTSFDRGDTQLDRGDTQLDRGDTSFDRGATQPDWSRSRFGCGKSKELSRTLPLSMDTGQPAVSVHLAEEESTGMSLSF